MKANEFVRDKGIEKAKEIIKKASLFGSHYRVDTQEVICCHNEQHFYFQDLVKLGVVFIRLDDLKGLVESHDLVESYGGLKESIRFSKQPYRQVSTPYTHKKLCDAIAGVESCQ